MSIWQILLIVLASILFGPALVGVVLYVVIILGYLLVLLAAFVVVFIGELLEDFRQRRKGDNNGNPT